MQIEQIRPNVYACLTGNETSNAAFVDTDRGVIVIDTFSSPDWGRKLAASIEGHTSHDVCLVINTHYHLDHIMGNQIFEAPVIAHCSLAPELAATVSRDLAPDALQAWVADHPEDQWLVDELKIIYPSITFVDCLVLDLPPLRMVLRHMGGHTPDSTIVDLPDEGVLIAGDLMFEGRVPYLGYANFRHLIDAMRRIETLGARTIVPGHGPLCAMTDLARLRNWVELLYNTVAELINQGLEKNAVLESDELPYWWTDDRPEVMQLNIERVYDEIAGERGAAI
jgi:cyclase